MIFKVHIIQKFERIEQFLLQDLFALLLLFFYYADYFVLSYVEKKSFF